jgi:hypothetical protein
MRILAPNWRSILKHAWSIRFIAVVAMLTGLDACFPFLDGLLPIPRWAFAALTCLISTAAIASRLLYQPKLWLGEKPNEPA